MINKVSCLVYISGQGDGQEPAALAGQLMQNPMVLAALQERLGSIAGGSSGYIQR